MAGAKQKHRQFRSHFSNRLLAFGIVTILALSSMAAISILESRPHLLRLVAYTPTESLENPRLPLIFQDLKLVNQGQELPTRRGERDVDYDFLFLSKRKNPTPVRIGIGKSHLTLAQGGVPPQSPSLSFESAEHISVLM